jgi:hypothetical protein
MKILYVADLHYSLRQFDWLLANAGLYDVAAIGEICSMWAERRIQTFKSSLSRSISSD